MSWTHTRRLAMFLEMERMGPNELKRTIETKVPKHLAYLDWDGKVTNVKQLLQTEGLASSTIIPTEVYGTLIEGSEPAKCMRNALPVYRMNSAVMAVPYGETGSYAPVVAEGAEIPIQTETIGAGTLTAKKYGVRPLISNEMVADGKFDIIATEIRKAGYKVENALNQVALSAILESSGGETDCAAAGTAAAFYAGIVGSIGAVVGNGFMPSDIILFPTAYGAIMGYVTTLNTTVANEQIKSGLLPTQLFGCNVHICGVSDTSATYTWGYGTNDYIGALVLDQNAAGAIGMRQDITVEQYSDPIHDLVGMKVVSRFDAVSLIANATYRVKY